MNVSYMLSYEGGWAYGGCVDTKSCQINRGCGLLGTSDCKGLCDEYNKGLVPKDHQ